MGAVVLKVIDSPVVRCGPLGYPEWYDHKANKEERHLEAFPRRKVYLRASMPGPEKSR